MKDRKIFRSLLVLGFIGETDVAEASGDRMHMPDRGCFHEFEEGKSFDYNGTFS